MLVSSNPPRRTGRRVFPTVIPILRGLSDSFPQAGAQIKETWSLANLNRPSRAKSATETFRMPRQGSLCFRPANFEYGEDSQPIHHEPVDANACRVPVTQIAIG